MAINMKTRVGNRPEWADHIDVMKASDRMLRMRKRYFDETSMIDGNRARLAAESWLETEGEHIEIRRAKKLKKILEGIPVVILEDELIVGSQTRFLRGANPFIDHNATYFPGKLVQKKEEGQSVSKAQFGGPMVLGNVTDQDLQDCVKAAAVFKGQSPSESIREIMKTMYGQWYEDAKTCRATVPFENSPYLPGVPVFENVIDNGLTSVIKRAQAMIDGFAESGDQDAEKLYFWRGVIITCEAVITFAHRYSAHASELATREKDPARRKELEQISEICMRVPEHPARTFQEAIQSFRFAHLGVMLEHAGQPPSFGRADQYLYEYFKKDMREGRLTMDRAAELVADYLYYPARMDCVYDTITGEINQTTAANNITLGGVDKDGKDASNELTYLFVHVMGLVPYSEPHLTLRYNSDLTPHWLMVKCLAVNRRSPGSPMYANDKHITGKMLEWGIPAEFAWDWVMVDCSQPASRPQRHYGTMHQNVPLCLDLALHDGLSPISKTQFGAKTGDPRNFKTFDELFTAFKKQYEFVYGRLMHISNIVTHARAVVGRLPLTSALHDGCIENGKDLQRGGSGKYPNWYMKDRGMVDVGDSLTAIKKLVFEDKKISMAELIEAMDANYQGKNGRNEEIRQMCLAVPKYGNDVDEADFMVRDVAKFTAAFIRSQNNPFGGKCTITRNGVSWHYMGGKGVGALPNGRKREEPLYDGSMSPMRGADKKGPTAIVSSALKADYKEATQSIFNMKFPLAFVQNQASLEKISMLAETFLGNGGLHIQFNFLDKQVLLDAQKHPDMHKDLIVRVAGYSAYFVQLTKEVQDDIIMRTEQNIDW